MEQRIGHGYKFIEELPFEELSRFSEHKRLTVFYNKGAVCANPDCNRVGTRLICGEDRGGKLHWDIYTEDLILMTVDHILPKSRGGGEELANKNPMCSPCNARKGNTIDLNQVEDPLFRAILEIKSQSNKTQQLLKNLINTKKLNRIAQDDAKYGEYLKNAVKESLKQNVTTHNLIEAFIKVSIEKGLFTSEDIAKTNLV